MSTPDARRDRAEHYCHGRRPAVLSLASVLRLFEITSVAELCGCVAGNNTAKVQKLFIDGGQPVMESRLESDRNIQNWEEAQ